MSWSRTQRITDIGAHIFFTIIVSIVFVVNNLILCCQIMYTSIVAIYESVIICMYV